MLDFRCAHRFSSGFELDVSFTCGRGVTALSGASGSGKTTVLNILAGFLQPDRGQITIGDDVILDSASKYASPLEDRGIGYVPQDELLFPHMSVKENLCFGKGHAADSGLAFEAVVEMLGLADFLRRRPGTLSGGQRQRVALGRAVLRGPRLLLMDEPMNALDAATKYRLIDDLCAIVDRLGIIAIFVSHDIKDAERFASRKITLDAGRVIA